MKLYFGETRSTSAKIEKELNYTNEAKHSFTYYMINLFSFNESNVWNDKIIFRYA